MTACAAIIESGGHVLALSGKVIKREAWSTLADIRSLLDKAERIRNNARAELDAQLVAAHAEGLLSGRIEGLAQMAADLLRVQAESRALLARDEARIADLACAVVARIAPRFDAAALVSALAVEAVREMQAEQYLQVRVHPDALARVEAETGTMREAHPGLTQIQVVADADLDPFGCVLVSESGKIEAGLDEQLASLRSALRKAASVTTEVA
jgi:flagellar biosynthesis/type III secretory pathway protein FliH